MVMDMFYAYVEMKRKKRVHFHGFMLDVHQSKLMIWKKFFLCGQTLQNNFPHFKVLNLKNLIFAKSMILFSFICFVLYWNN